MRKSYKAMYARELSLNKKYKKQIEEMVSPQKYKVDVHYYSSRLDYANDRIRILTSDNIALDRAWKELLLTVDVELMAHRYGMKT